jgi:molecular chaperone DnaK (HSP70)
MDIVTTAVLVAIVVGLLVALRRSKGGAARPAPTDYMDSLTPKPLKPPFEVDDWDGYSGIRLALCVELSGGMCYPILPAGSALPATAAQTVSTSSSEQPDLAFALYVGMSEELSSAYQVMRVSIGPIPESGDGSRVVEAIVNVDETGFVSVTAATPEGVPVEHTVIEVGNTTVPNG